MATRHVTRRAAASEEPLLCTGLQVEHGDFRVVDAASVDDREEHRLTTGQKRRPAVIDLAAFAIGARQHGRRPAVFGYLFEPCRGVFSREDDCAALAPRK